MNEIFGCVVFICTALHLFPRVARATCDLEAGSDCINKVTGGGCISTIDSNFVTTEVGKCRSAYVDDCTTFVVDIWDQALSTVIDGLKDECTQGCVNASSKLINCKDYMYSGLDKLANDIITNHASPSDVQCTPALARIYKCIVDAVTNCESLEYYALSTLESQEMAFKQCNITFRPLISHNITEENNNNNKTIDIIPENTSLKMALLSGIAVTGVIVLVAGGLILYLWISKIRESNYRKPERSSDSLYTFGSDTAGMSSSMRTSRIHRSRSIERASDSLRSGQIPWTRWWTRPGFGTYGADIQNFGI